MDCLVTSTAGVGAAATTTSADEAGEAAASLKPLSGEQIAPPSVLLPEEKPYWLTTWSSHDHMTIICSAPEFSLSGFEVMNGLFDTCRWYP
eukprot:COSAG03_NODE_11743_length_578_cov_0.862213_1_plen_90_part_01